MTKQSEQGATIYQLVYRSIPTEVFSDAMLSTLLEKARDRNRANGITGVLMYNEEFFAQCLEGAEAEVKSLLGRIGRDTRHHSLVVVFSQKSRERAFSDWYMGCTRLSDTEALQVATSRWEAAELNPLDVNPASPGFVLLRALWDTHKAAGEDL